MATLPAEDRLFLKEFYNSVMDKPLAPDDPRCVRLYEDYDALGDDPVELLEQTITFESESVQLLAGFRGIGKSTEMRRLKKRLEDAGCKVVLVDMRAHVDISAPVELTLFLGYIAGVFESAMEDPTLLGPMGIYGSVGGRSRSASGIWRLLDFTENVSPWTRVITVRDFFRDCSNALRKRHGIDTKIVIIVDSVEHIRGTFANAAEVMASIEKLFIANASDLRIPGLHVVYTIPPILKMRHPGLGSLYSSAVQLLSAVKINNFDGSVANPGMDALLDLIKKRHADASRLLPDDEFRRIIAASGGNLRDLLRILAEVIRRTKKLPADSTVVTRALNQMRNEALPIAANDAMWLAKVAKTHEAALEDQADLVRLAHFFDTNLLLCYRNGREWYDVHPLIRGEVLKMAEEVEAERDEKFSESGTGLPPGTDVERSRPKTIDASELAIGLMSLRLCHIRLLNDITIDFTRNGAPRPFTLILAENGHGKTTVLQAIALAASGVAGANLLAGNAAAFFDRRLQDAGDSEECRIEAHFNATRAELHAPPTWKEFAGSSAPSLDEVRAQDKPQWFVAGYGTGRMLPRSRASKEPGRRAVDRLRSLFDAEPLVATGFADILADLLGRKVAQQFAETLRVILIGNHETPGLLPNDEHLHLEELELRGSGAVRESNDLVEADRFVLRLGDHRIGLPAAWLSAGYQSTIAWVADLLGQVTLEAGRVLQPREIAGIVLIDEIDLHLHPQWQASLVSSLRAIFPKVQFIATTHSPMVLPGLRQDEIVMLSLDAQGHVQQRPAPVAPALKTGSEILEWFFGIEKLYPARLGQVLQEYTHLASDPERTDEEETRMQDLRRQLFEADADPGWEPQARIQAGS